MTDKFDIDDFDTDHPVFREISYRLHVHNKMRSDSRKRWLVPRWIGDSDLAVIFGASEAGKSVFAVDLACRLAAGIDLAGNETLVRHNVLYIAAERAPQVRRRIDAFVKHHNGEPFDNLVIYDGPIDLTGDPAKTLAIVRAAGWAIDDEGDGVNVVFVDTLAAAMSASDSSPEAMAAATATLTAITRHGQCEDSGCAVVAIHHTPVSGEARLRGGGQLQGAADTTIHVARKRGVSTAKVVKNNETIDRPSLSYTMETVPLATDGDGIETTAPVLVQAEAPAPREASKSGRAPKAERDAKAALARAVAKHGGPVTEDQLRDVIYAEASDISEGARWKRAGRLLARLQSEGGLYSTPA